ncbi:MAG TPA: alkaline phosphatase family protein [Ginsengibacter sp.]|nr:alkaline phosphatase family protein [Ginsengibacter sp.]HRP44792.1 alkaline phosphatase family protein [Ginsengibacter sp.]
MKQKLISVFVFIFLFLGFSNSGFAQSTHQVDRPKLVVGIVVDQMRWDYLCRYYDRYGNGGFKRLLNEGFTCENAFISHLPSYTAVGHATVYTGSVPAIHGITGNDWKDQVTGRKWYCVEDTTVETVGADNKNGKMSPRNLLATTVTDELRLATNFRSKVVGVSLKDRASILPAGHAANAAFWFDDKTGHFISSTYYMKELPEWVQKFNKANRPAALVAEDWNTLYPMDTYTQSTADNVEWEGIVKDEEESPVFPHRISKYYDKKKGEIRSTPFGNTLTLEFAKAALEGNRMGQGAFTDFLTINCASTDYVGHRYGPNSIEVEDTYLRLDKDLEDFFYYLDRNVGIGNYTVFLTADHGAAHSIKFMEAHNLPAGFFESKPLMKNLKAFLKAKFRTDKIVKEDLNYHVALDKELIEKLNLDYDKVKRDIVQFLQTQPGVEFAADIENLGNSPIPEPIKTMIANGYNPKRAGALIIIQDPGWFSSNGKGTTHGSWNPHDTHIPMVFMGWGIKHGRSTDTYHMTDIAPTISALLHIQMPSGAVGRVVSEALK